MRKELKELTLNEVELKKTEMRKISDLKDCLLDTKRRVGSEKIFITRLYILK